jgi:recombination protein RecA
VIFINQIREKIGVFFGSPETTTGGRALKFYSSVRLDIRRIGSIKVGEELKGNRVKVTVVKNKMAPPFRRAEFDVMFNRGISREGEIIDMGVEKNVIEKSGTWMNFGATRLGQGRDRACEFLAENPDVLAELETKVRAAYVPAPEPAAQAPATPSSGAPMSSGASSASAASAASASSGASGHSGTSSNSGGMGASPSASRPAPGGAQPARGPAPSGRPVGKSPS